MTIQEAFRAMHAEEYARVNRERLFQEVSDRADELEITRHPLGFVHVELTQLVSAAPGERFRLHVWDRPSGSLDDLGDLHDHVWSLRSLVMLGALTDSTYRAVPATDGPYLGARVKYGATNSAEPDTRYRLEVAEHRTIGPGEAYEIPPGLVHVTTITRIPSVTLLLAVDDPEMKMRGPLVLSRSPQLGQATEARPRIQASELRAKLSAMG